MLLNLNALAVSFDTFPAPLRQQFTDSSLQDEQVDEILARAATANRAVL
jgi:hypothetical protein